MRERKEADDGMVICPECCGDKGHEETINVCGETEWRECDLCHGEGQIEDNG